MDFLNMDMNILNVFQTEKGIKEHVLDGTLCILVK